jgi:hypothetical protein
MWEDHSSADPRLFAALRHLAGCRIYLRFEHDTRDGLRVEVPSASLTLQGELTVELNVDRFGIRLPGGGVGDFAWFSRRKARGRPEYWQGAIEQHRDGGPALVLYFTAPADGLTLRTCPAGSDPPPGEPAREASL